MVQAAANGDTVPDGVPTIPVISLSNFEKRKAHIAQELLTAARDVGFWYVCDHGEQVSCIDQPMANCSPALCSASHTACRHQ